MEMNRLADVTMDQVLDSITTAYDRWYDTPEGSDVFRAERDYLPSLYAGPSESWFEVGVGTGRFAAPPAFGLLLSRALSSGTALHVYPQ